MRITVIGAGSWGTAIAVHLAKTGRSVVLWNREEENFSDIPKYSENRKYLPGVEIPESIELTCDLEYAVSSAEIVVYALPSPLAREYAKKMSSAMAEGTILVNLAKGLERDSLKRLSEVFSEEIPNAKIVVMSGPSHAEEVGRGLPTTNVVASCEASAALLIQKLFMSEDFRLYTEVDVVGVELGGALKNIIALCAGISDGLGFGDNTKAALLTRGLAEIKRLGVAMGADAETFLGLSGVGDLIVTCTSMHSRNRRAGIMIGKGKKLSETLDEIGMVVEGVNTASTALELSRKFGIEMPIVEEANRVLFEDKNPRDAVSDLMSRDRKWEKK